MKLLVVVALFLACANASKLSEQVVKFIPSFATGYVIKGEDAAPHAAPYIVSLSRSFAKHSHICGGTIIAKDWIVTAAHCINKAEGMGVIAGLHVRTDVDEKAQARQVDFGRVHELYTGGVGPFDIAILHVSQPFEFNEWVQPAVLPSSEEIYEDEAHLYGWGQPKAYVLTGAKTLQTVTTRILPFSECQAALPETAPLATSNVCSDSLNSGISACNGDSGGPLVREHLNASPELIGIVSWGYIPCGVGNMPSIYTRVSAYIDWINKIQNSYYVIFHKK